MATEIPISTEKTQKFISELETQKTILTSATQLFTTLAAHFTSFQKTLTDKTQTLDFKFQSLESFSTETLISLFQRESSIPERESLAAARIEDLKAEALLTFKGKDGFFNKNLGDSLKFLCKRMDSAGLLRFLASRRKESVSLRGEISKALAEEAVDPARLVLEAVEEFLRDKVGKLGITDKRWACGVLVQALFEEGKRGGGPVFSRRTVERSWKVLERWREEGGGGGVAGPVEAVMFLQMVVGFGLKARYDEEYLKKLVVEHASRRDMAKVAAGMGFGETLGDIIDELVKNGKEIEAVYFAVESGLTERFPPVSLLKSFLKNCKKNTTALLRSGDFSPAAKAESNVVELNAIKAIMKCVEDHKLESQFPLDSLKKRATRLEKAKADRKKSSAAATAAKIQNKRGHGSSVGRAGGPPASRPAKAAKFSNTIPSFGRRISGPPSQLSPPPRYSDPYGYPSQVAGPHPQLSPTTRYSDPYGYPSQSMYGGQPPTPYGSTYGVSHSQSPVGQPHYSLPVENMGSVTYRATGSYGGHASYATYDYPPGAPSMYQPPS